MALYWGFDANIQKKLVWYQLSNLYVPLEVSNAKVHKYWDEGGLHGGTKARKVLETMKRLGVKGDDKFDMVAELIEAGQHERIK